MNKKFTSTVAGASILLTVVGLMSRGLGLIREVVFAGSFGLSTQYDLFLVGTVFPLTINTVVAYIAQNYFIPIYNRLKNNSLAQARTFTTRTIFMFTLGGIIVMALMFLLSDFIINHYLNYPDTNETALAVKVLKIYAVTIPFSSAFSVLAAFLYSEFDFKLPAFSQLLVNIAVIIGVLIFSESLGVISIAVSYLLGIVIQLLFIILYIIRKRIPLFALKASNKKILFWDSGILLIIIIEALSQVYLISDRYFLTQVDKGGIAALNYSMNIFLLPITIISVALSTALFPSFSKSFVENNINQIKEKLSIFFSLDLYLFIPISFLFIFFGDLLIRLLFQRGQFSAGDSLLTYETLKYFSISLVFFSCYAILNKLMYSLQLIKPLLVVTLIGCSIKILFNFILVGYMKQNGLALSSSISYSFFFFFSLVLIRKKVGFSLNTIFLKRIVFLTSNAFIAYYLSKIIIYGFAHTFSVTNVYIEITQLLVFSGIYLINSIFFDRSKITMLIKLLPIKNTQYGSQVR